MLFSIDAGRVIMALFDAYVMIDWSGADRRHSGRQDCIWIAYGPAIANKPTTVSPASRTEAEHLIRSELHRIASVEHGRVLVCADFGYAYPAGFAALLQSSSEPNVAPWRVVWRFLKEHIRDDLGTRPGGPPTNRSNRFEVASAINRAASAQAAPGPFWCLHKAGSHECIPQKKPLPLVGCTGSIHPLRLTDRRARSDTPFRLFGTGSVGGQVLTGIPRLANLRFDPEFANQSAVWPFETGWAPLAGSWLGSSVKIVHAEIYPSLRSPLPDTIKDRGQVRAMWRWARDLDERKLLAGQFALPVGIRPESYEDNLIRNEEGWILGTPTE